MQLNADWGRVFGQLRVWCGCYSWQHVPGGDLWHPGRRKGSRQRDSGRKRGMGKWVQLSLLACCVCVCVSSLLCITPAAAFTRSSNNNSFCPLCVCLPSSVSLLLQPSLVCQTSALSVHCVCVFVCVCLPSSVSLLLQPSRTLSNISFSGPPRNIQPLLASSLPKYLQCSPLLWNPNTN